ncbi:amino acid deaminase [Microbacterium sp. Mu-80]|uniref:Amino acid deaminase n=1 Tax=Microbacterium bandirmense TaxID=3122050 RepID=A0ABU8LAP0_9MICO
MRTRSVPNLAPVLELIERDARHDRFSHWGLSTVIDENTGEPVIDRPLFDALHAAAGITAEYPIGNAGVIHVYGYWFSTAVTPYGYKRDRWQNGELARALGKSETHFHLFSDPDSTPLQRVTAATLPLLRDPPKSTEGTADARAGALDTRVVLVAERDSPVSALIYGIRAADAWRLITTFPLAGEPAAVIDDFLADRRLRWNAAIPL